MHKDFSFEDLNFKQETTEHLLYSMIEVLHDAGFRVTTQRKIILEAIAQQVGCTYTLRMYFLTYKRKMTPLVWQPYIVH